ncbi:TetR/AcrR family transcriptional regulator [Mycobacterium sp. URHB0044]|uniref:TetR/AcrR family transcriptional regulator n=1 Tax=Mycobacterium sp. URHB0044 TaxID=1380386 RepID=UPI0018CC2B2F|nr:TetR/AcrR family transcriptional regulator [Mycobacterium sp. URHB0044]
MPGVVEVERTRERMIRCALELFTERGYDGASIGMIASNLGVAKSAVSYHFRTKEDLLVAVMQPAVCDLDAYFEKFGTGPLRPVRRREAITEWVQLTVKHRALLGFLAKEGDRDRPEPGFARWPSAAEQLTQLLAGGQPDLGERIYLGAAIRGLATAPAMFPEAGDADLEQHLLRFAETTLARRRRTTVVPGAPTP